MPTFPSSVSSRLVLPLLLVLLALPMHADAQTEGFGVGATLGVTNSAQLDVNPVGLAVKGWVTDRQALAGVASLFIGDDTRSYALLQGDLLFHNFNKLDVGEGLLALYIGAGAQLVIIDDANDQFSLRGPLGVNYLLGSSPIDVYVEVAPTLKITNPSALRFDGAIGFRYFF